MSDLRDSFVDAECTILIYEVENESATTRTPKLKTRNPVKHTGARLIREMNHAPV